MIGKKTNKRTEIKFTRLNPRRKKIGESPCISATDKIQRRAARGVEFKKREVATNGQGNRSDSIVYAGTCVFDGHLEIVFAGWRLVLTGVFILLNWETLFCLIGVAIVGLRIFVYRGIPPSRLRVLRGLPGGFFFFPPRKCKTVVQYLL